MVTNYSEIGIENSAEEGGGGQCRSLGGETHYSSPLLVPPLRLGIGLATPSGGREKGGVTSHSYAYEAIVNEAL